jgi:hypothetical protein
MVWQEVPQKAGELVYSQAKAPVIKTAKVNIPRTAYGRTRTHRGEPAGGKKKLLTFSRNLFIASPFHENANGMARDKRLALEKKAPWRAYARAPAS